MRALERFGGWCLDEGRLFLWIVFALSVGAYIYQLPKTVTIEAKEWECSLSAVRGIDAVCIVYSHKGVH